MAIEQRLVEAVQQLSLSDVLQDIECTRCHGVTDTHTYTHTQTHTLSLFTHQQVKDGNINDYCNCAGEFCNTSSSHKLTDQLIMFDSIAK